VPDITPAQARQALMVLRGAVGAAVWLAPRPTGRVLGIDPGGNPAPFVARLFAARSLGMVAALAGGLRGYLPKRTAFTVALTALGETALGVIARRD
jgi:hypothetical protein